MFHPASHSAAARIGMLVPALLLSTACGKRGSPFPPLPRGPLPPAEVAARQIGGRSVVGFRVPEARGPKPSQHPIRAELIRVTYPPGLEPQTDPDAFRRRG